MRRRTIIMLLALLGIALLIPLRPLKTTQVDNIQVHTQGLEAKWTIPFEVEDIIEYTNSCILSVRAFEFNETASAGKGQIYQFNESTFTITISSLDFPDTLTNVNKKSLRIILNNTQIAPRELYRIVVDIDYSGVGNLTKIQVFIDYDTYSPDGVNFKKIEEVVGSHIAHISIEISQKESLEILSAKILYFLLYFEDPDFLPSDGESFAVTIKLYRRPVRSIAWLGDYVYAVVGKNVYVVKPRGGWAEVVANYSFAHVDELGRLMANTTHIFMLYYKSPNVLGQAIFSGSSMVSNETITISSCDSIVLPNAMSEAYLADPPLHEQDEYSITVFIKRRSGRSYYLVASLRPSLSYASLPLWDEGNLPKMYDIAFFEEQMYAFAIRTETSFQIHRIPLDFSEDWEYELNNTVDLIYAKVAVGDLDNDSYIDVATFLNDSGTYKVSVWDLDNNVSHSLINYTIPSGAYDIVVADFDGDGLDEVAVLGDTAVYVYYTYLNTVKYAITVDGGVLAPNLGDLDDDGRVDIFGVNDTLDKLIVAYGNGTSASYALPQGVWMKPTLMADIDDDGKLELILATEDKIYCFDTPWGSYAASQDQISMSTTYRGVAYSDFDGDGLSNSVENDIGTNPYLADTDSDGLTDGYEYNTVGTNPLDPDTDGDGMSDGYEIANGLDPLTPGEGSGGDSDTSGGMSGTAEDPLSVGLIALIVFIGGTIAYLRQASRKKR